MVEHHMIPILRKRIDFLRRELDSVGLRGEDYLRHLLELSQEVETLKRTIYRLAIAEVEGIEDIKESFNMLESEIDERIKRVL